MSTIYSYIVLRSKKKVRRQSRRVKKVERSETNDGDAKRRSCAAPSAALARGGASALRASNEASPRNLGLASALRASNEASPRKLGRPARRAG